jgi:uncharacterized protein involved in exopolysaccharide biosynthesis
MVPSSTVSPVPDAPPTPLLHVLRQWWPVLAGCTLAGVAAALVWSARLPRLYEATTTIVVTPGDPSPAAQAAAVTNARTLLENRTIADKVIRQNDLGAPPESLAPENLVRERLTVSQIRDTNYMRVSLRLQSRELAAKALRQLVEAGVSLNSDLVLQETKSVTGTLLQQQVEDARAALAVTTERLLELRRSARIEQLRADAEASLQQRSRARQLAAEVAAERARVTRAEEQIAHRPRLLPAPRATSGEGPLLEHARRVAELPLGASQSAGTAAPRNRVFGEQRDEPPAADATEDAREQERREAPMSLSAASPLLDPVYEVLDYQAAVGRTRLAALEGERAAMRGDANADLQRLYAAEAALAQRQLDRELALETYKRVTQQYGAARESALMRSLRINMADAPVPPSGSASPNYLLNGVIGGAAALLCGVAAMFLIWRRSAPAL